MQDRMSDRKAEEQLIVRTAVKRHTGICDLARWRRDELVSVMHQAIKDGVEEGIFSETQARRLAELTNEEILAVTQRVEP